MGKTKASSASVHFDFEAALRCARSLWALSGTLGELTSRRQSAAGAARVDFAGTYADQFESRCGGERASAGNVARGLRNDALRCAQLWKDAMDQQNRYLYARQVDKVKAKRSNLEKIGDALTGFDYPPHPDGVPVPQAPGFAPTATLVSYPS